MAVKSDFTLVMPLDSSEEAALKVAKRSIKTLLHTSNFEIKSIVLIEEGELKTPKGVMQGKRYQVKYENKLPN